MGICRVRLQRRVQYVYTWDRIGHTAARERRQMRIRVPHESQDQRLRFYGIREAVKKNYRTLWPQLSRPVRRSIPCGAIRVSRRSWLKPRWASSKRWPASAKPEESEFSAGDFLTAITVDFC